MNKLITLITIGSALYVIKKRGKEWGFQLPDAPDWIKQGSKEWSDVMGTANQGALAEYFAGATEAFSEGLTLAKESPVVVSLQSTLAGVTDSVIEVVPQTFSGAVGNVFNDSMDDLLKQISEGEGTSEQVASHKGYRSGYDITLGYGKYLNDKIKPITTMNFKELKAFQTSMLRNGRNKLNSSACGKFQNTRTNLFGNNSNNWYGMMQTCGFSLSDKYSKSAQIKIAKKLLEIRGYHDYKNGVISAKDFQSNLSEEWASIADPYKNDKSHYGQHVGTTTAQIMPIIESIA